MVVSPEPRAKRWLFKPFPDAPEQQAAIETLTAQLGVNPFLVSLLVQRGVTSFDEARQFFRPVLDHLHDPFLMQDMDRAVERLVLAQLQGEKILIYGDYDVDGTTSVALVYGFLRHYVTDIDFYIPDRYAEGYGVSRRGIEWAAEQGFSLIITLDCGIKSVELVEEAKALGVDFIICDHHRPGPTLPPAVAVLDPKRDDCQYPYKELTGCGVGFKLLQAFCQFQGISEETLRCRMDLVVVSIAADIVPITGENRVLAHYGLQCLNSSPCTGLRALMNVAALRNELDITSVVFGLGPRINAAGRIKHARAAVLLLLAETPEEAEEMAFAINKHNQDRQQFDSSITEQALAMIRENDTFRQAKSTVLFNATWHKGVVGIVASRCIEHFYRPTIILTDSHGKAAGSARSVPGFDVYEAIEACADLLEQFGGHTFAAGMTLPIENVEAFRAKFEDVVASRIAEEHLTPRVEVDMPLDFSAIDDKFCRILKQMAPFGPQNLAPVFVTEDVYAVSEPRVLKDKHLKLQLRQGRNGRMLSAIGFGLGAWAAHLRPGEPFAVCYQVEQNHFNGRVEIQLTLKDLRLT